MSESLQIYISSNSADSSSSGTYTFLLPLIEVSSQFHLYISVANASIPISYYNINSNNNVLKYAVLGSIYTLTFTVGNYNVNTLRDYFFFPTYTYGLNYMLLYTNYLQACLTNHTYSYDMSFTLRDYLNSVMTNFTVTYNKSTNKYTFTHNSADFGFIENGSTCFKLLGISTDGINSTSQILTSTNACDLLPIKALCVETNLQTGNFNKVTPQSGNTLCQLPVDVSQNGLLTYINNIGYKSNLFTNVLNSIDIRICDQDGNHINFNGCDWSLTIQIDILDFVKDDY